MQVGPPTGSLTVDIGLKLWLPLEELAQLRGLSPNTVGGQALRVFLDGRLALRESKQSSLVSVQGIDAGALATGLRFLCVEPPLVNKLRSLAEILGRPAVAVCHDALRHFLFGDCGNDAIVLAPTGHQIAWQQDVDPVSVWLPEAVLQKLDELCDQEDLYRSDAVRNALFVGLFGRLGLERAKMAGLWTVSRRSDCTVMFSEQDAPGRTAFVSHFGKSVESVKVWVPSPFKRALGDLAGERRMRVSELVRRMLCTYLIGRLHFDAMPIAEKLLPNEADED